MGFFDFLKKKTTRYAVVIALVGTLVAGCRKGLSPEESSRISALGAEVEKGLKKGTPDQQKINDFVRAVAKAKKYHNVNVPFKLTSAVQYLTNYYLNYDQRIEPAEYSNIKGDIPGFLR